jgi:uncharacterized membrane protein
MTVEVLGMIGAGVITLLAGLILLRDRFRAASGAGRVVVLGPLFYATALAIFAAEHFFAARSLVAVVPPWVPGHLFWVYFVGAAWLAAAVSFIAWREVRWSAPLVVLLFLIIVATIDLPGVFANWHDRFSWILAMRELSFAGGAMVLTGCVWPRANRAGAGLAGLGRGIVAATMIFYAIEQFLHPRHVPGVPLEKLTPAWIPAPQLLAYLVGMALLAAGIALLIRRRIRSAAAGAGTVLLLLTVFFYIPILVTEIHSARAVEGMNYVGDTLLFAATVLLAGFGPELLSDLKSPAEDLTSEGVEPPARVTQTT